MIKAGIIGATGYAGAEAARLLKGHPEAEVIWYGSRSYIGQPYADVYGNMRNIAEDNCKGEDMAELAEEADVIFTATPQGFCASHINKEILAKTKVIDLSADFRFRDVDVYEQWYGIKHAAPELLPEAVYGLCELYRDQIRKTSLVANPGCYTTCSILSLYPLVKEKLVIPETIIIDAKSGTSGAGRGAKTDNLFCEVNENIKAYSPATHRHTPEIEEHLSAAAGKPVMVNFTPHLVPMNRGILVTAYASLAEGVAQEQIAEAYQAYYGSETFIRLLKPGICAQTKWVEGSNYTDIGFTVDQRTGRVIVMAALDNLVKGAAGAAVQNMNILFGLPENCGLDLYPAFP